MKILGLGLSKTGTSSLAVALNLLGYSCVHSAHTYLIEQADALLDMPAAVRFRELDVMYPGSKFILTSREKNSWLDSCRRHWDRIRIEEMHPNARFEYAWCRVRAFGTTEFDPDNHWRCYTRHLDAVTEHFANRLQDILVMDIIAGDGWTKLCPFLGVPVPDMPFPWKNRDPRLAK